MDKITRKRSSGKPIDRIRALLVRKLAYEYNYTEQTIRTAINGYGQGVFADQIKRQFEKEYQQLTDLITPAV